MPSRYIHPGLLSDIQKSATTLCLLAWIQPVTPGFVGYGATDTNRDLRYDPGDGERLFSASVGFDASEIQAKADLSVDNAEAKQLMPVYDFPINEEDIAAGIYDYAEFVVYLVNYENLTPGRHCVLQEGTIGKVSVRDDGLSVVNELRGLSAQLKQEICTKYTKTCRAIDGTMPIGSPLPGPQVKRDWCGVDFTVYLKTATVEEVGLETTLTFKVMDDDITTGWATNSFSPGRVWFTSGRNAGRELEIMSNTADGWITLRHETGYPIEPGDEIEYREGCTFIARDDAKGCRAHAGAEWINHFKGYPDIPTENESQLLTPGAALGAGSGGRTSVPYDQEQA